MEKIGLDIYNFEEKKKDLRKNLIDYLGFQESDLDIMVRFKDKEIRVIGIKKKKLIDSSGIGGYYYNELSIEELIKIYKEIERKKYCVYKIRNTTTNEIWISGGKGVVSFAKMIAESIDPDWIEDHKQILKDIGYKSDKQLSKFVEESLITAKRFLETNNDYVINEIGDRRAFVEALMHGECVSINEEGK